MGCDPEAKLFYGIIPDIDNHNIDLSDLEHSWEEHCVPQPLSGDPLFSEEWIQWRQNLKQWKRTSPLSVKHVLYGYSSELGHAICCSQFYFEAEWDEVTVIPNPLPTPSQEHIDGLKAFCDHFGIPWKEPQWHLVSLYF